MVGRRSRHYQSRGCSNLLASHCRSLAGSFDLAALMLDELKSLQENQPGQRMWLSREAVLILRVGNGFDPPGWRLDKGYNSLKPRPEAGLRLC